MHLRTATCHTTQRRSAEAEAAAAAAAVGDSKEQEVDEPGSMAAAIQVAPVRDEPVPTKPWAAFEAAATEQAVHNAVPQNSRPQIHVRLRRRRSAFRGRAVFNDRDAGEAVLEFRSRRDPAFELQAVEREVSLQACAGCLSRRANAGTQTVWRRPVSKGVCTDAVAIATRGVPQPGSAEEAVISEELSEFLASVLQPVEHALSQNETLNIYTDHLSALLEEQSGSVLARRDQRGFKEIRTFMDLARSNNKSLPAVAWDPKQPSWLAMSISPNLSFAERLDEAGSVSTHHVLLFRLEEFAAQTVLEAPYPVVRLAWNPTLPHLLAAGTSTGHVLLYDLQAMQSRGGARHDIDNSTLVLQPIGMAASESAHSTQVVHMEWLPPSYQVSVRGKGFEASVDGKSWQFLSVGRDGKACVWDARWREHGAARASRVRRPDPNDPGNIVKAAGALIAALPVNVPWHPLYRAELWLGSAAACFTAASLNPSCPSDPLWGVTETGDVVAADWAPPGSATHLDAVRGRAAGEAAANSHRGNTSAPAESDDSSRVLWHREGNARPGRAVQRSPFYNDVWLVVHTWHFEIWKVGLREPVFSSTPSPSQITCGVWCPTRPAVILLGRQDGQLDVWDILDSTLASSMSSAVAATALTSITFRRRGATEVEQPWSGDDGRAARAACMLGRPARLLLAIGDARGSMHVLEVPSALTHGPKHEDETVYAYINREVARVDYYANRWKQRDAELGAAKAAAASAEVAAAAAEAATAQSAQKIRQELATSMGLPDADISDKRVARALKLQEQAKEQQQYDALEADIMEQLGISFVKYWGDSPPQDVSPEVVDSALAAEAARAEDGMGESKRGK